MKKYDVTGKLYLSKEQYQMLLEKGNYTHVKKAGEQKYTPATSKDLEYDKPWIYIRNSFQRKKDAINYADKMVKTGVSGSYADVTEVVDFLWNHTRMHVYSTAAPLTEDAERREENEQE